MVARGGVRGRRQPNASISGQIPKKTHILTQKAKLVKKMAYFPSFRKTTAFACRVPNSDSSNLCPDSFFVAIVQLGLGFRVKPTPWASSRSKAPTRARAWGLHASRKALKFLLIHHHVFWSMKQPQLSGPQAGSGSKSGEGQLGELWVFCNCI